MPPKVVRRQPNAQPAKRRKRTREESNIPAQDASAEKKTPEGPRKRLDEENSSEKENSLKCYSCCGCCCSATNDQNRPYVEWQKLMKKICENVEQITTALAEAKFPKKTEPLRKPSAATDDNELRTPPTADDGTGIGFQPVSLTTLEMDNKKGAKESLLDRINATLNKQWNAGERSEYSFDRTETFADNASNWESLFVVLVLIVFGILLAFIYGGIPGVTFNSGALSWRQL